MNAAGSEGAGTSSEQSGEERALAALERAGLAHEVTRHGRVGSLEEAARVRGVQPRDIVKTLVVRRAEGDYLFVLVPGDREISWPKLRALLGVNRLSMPDAATAQVATGYERGTITPFGSATAWPVVADASLTAEPGRLISMGAGAHGAAVTVDAAAALEHLQAQVADVTEPAG
ncbi:aminoacyl-tRNA deacylase [Ornithinimicrobium pratense]|uniref:YbaK/EbsC family protein n=1 Tax=Ornithinimicrobium pratense TaxID=2593973 RepID=A0A5J6V9E2_9MICO|nr:YbaK/EbsC family protein [Ornithinimicrobium pratense]QFG69816.1 YbaK/EbsC family protein [Ornithinimicrobium pratense]